MKRGFLTRTGIRSIIRRALWLGSVAVAGYFALCFLLLVLFRWVNPPTTSIQIQRRIECLWTGTEYAKQQRFVPLSRISNHLEHAVIAAEDGAFYQHSGIDWDELRKVWREKHRKRMRGGSTITQQLDKNLFMLTHRSLVRKAGEFILAPVTEWVLPKERTLELYLNVIEWGPGIYGAEAAARHYYRTSAARLNREQAARLAALIPNPRQRRPGNVNRYARQILNRMSQRGW